MTSRLLSQNSLFSALRVQPWTCAQCAAFSSSAVALKGKDKKRPSSGARSRSPNFKKSSSRSSAKFGTTSRTRLVKDLKPKTYFEPEGKKERGKLEVAPKRFQRSPPTSQTPFEERKRKEDSQQPELKPRSLQSKAAVERAGVEALLDSEFDRSSASSSSKPSSSNAQLPTSFTSPPLLPGLHQSIQSILGTDAQPTPIQSLALKHLFPLSSTSGKWREFLLASETGSGKSFAYLLPLVQYLKQSESEALQTTSSNLLNPRALVLAPTHELTRQLSSFAKSLVHNAKLRVLCASRANAPAQADRRHSAIATLGTARQMKHALSSLEDGNTSSEIGIDRKLQAGGKSRLIDALVGTPVKALEMVRGWGWDKVDKEEQTMPWEKEGKPERKFRPGKPEMSLERVECVIVDEADVLFDPDFRQTTLELLSDISAARGHDLSSSSPKELNYPFHLILTSATIPASLSSYLSKHHPSLTRLASPHLHRLPATLATEHVPTTGSSGQRFADVERRLRRVWAEDALRGPDARAGKVLKSKVLVFCNKSSTVERLGEYLREKGIENVPLTSMSAARTRGSNKHIQPFLKGFEEDATSANANAPNVLVTTSLLSRGLDFSSTVKHVFIFDAPRNMIDFLHRAGRAARAGEHGRVVVFGKLKGRGSGTDKDVRQKVKALAH